MTTQKVTCSILSMDTPVSLHIISSQREEEIWEKAERAFAWFQAIEQACSRFDMHSEVMQLTTQIGIPVEVSPLLFEVIRFSLEVARLSGGAFDPTVGAILQGRGFNRHYLSGLTIASSAQIVERPSYKDIRLDAIKYTVTLLQPHILDLGGVAKGLAIDMAAKELHMFSNYAIDAGGDLYVKGCNEQGEFWHVGIRHPQQEKAVIESLQVPHGAICTSGDYERPAPINGEGHHLIDPHTGCSPTDTASVTVIAPNALLADALSTTAFVLGPTKGLHLLQSCGVDGVIFSSSLERYATKGFKRYTK